MKKWPPEAAARLRRLLRETMTQPALVERTGIPIATLQRIIAGGTDPGPDRLGRIASALGVTVDAILVGDAAAITSEQVPVYDISVAAGAGRFIFDNADPIYHWPFPTAWLGQFGAGADLKLVQVTGDSQEPELSDGDMVMIDAAATRLRDGMHVVRLDDALLIKRVQVQGSRVLLKSANVSYDDIMVDLSAEEAQFQIVGRAVWASKML